MKKNEYDPSKLKKMVDEYASEYVEHNGLPPTLLKSIAHCIHQEITDGLANNEGLRASLKNGDTAMKDLLKMTPQQLRPDAWHVLLTKQKAAQDVAQNKSTTSDYECPKCQKRKATITYVQTRSADEPMTMFVHCVECGHAQSFE